MDSRTVPVAAIVSEPILKALELTVAYQDRMYGPFSSAVGSVRLAVACLEDEVAEVRGAWRKERRKPEKYAPLWPMTREETLQVAAIAIRILRDCRALPDD